MKNRGETLEIGERMLSLNTDDIEYTGGMFWIGMEN